MFCIASFNISWKLHCILLVSLCQTAGGGYGSLWGQCMAGDTAQCYSNQDLEAGTQVYYYIRVHVRTYTAPETVYDFLNLNNVYNLL